MHHPVPALRGLVPVTSLIAVTLLAYAPSAVALWSFWDSQPFLGGQGPLVVALSAWLIVRSRSALEATRMRPSAWGCAALLVCSVASVTFWRSGIEELHMLLLPLLLLLAVLAAFGRGAARILAFPLGYLYFAEPTWRILIGPLQSLTMRAVVLMSPLTGTPMAPSGTLLRLPNGVTFEVTPLCSGVNFLVVGLAVAALIGELQRASLRRRAALLAGVALLMVVSNWLRVLLIVLAGYTSGMRLLVTRGHVLFGWVLFALVVLGFSLWAARRAPIVLPDAVPQRETGATRALRLAGAGTAAAILVLMPLLARASAAVLHAGDVLALHLPAAPAGWQGPLASIDTRWKPEFVGAHSEWHAAYRDGDGAIVELLAVGYPTQEQDRELVNEQNSLLGNDDLTAVGDATIVRGAQPHFEYLATDATGHSFVIWSVYDIGGRRFVTPLYSQLWYGLRSLSRAPYSVQFAYRAVCEPSCDGARARLASFERSVAGAITVTRAAPASTTAGGPAI
jgi:EpsI family protein